MLCSANGDFNHPPHYVPKNVPTLPPPDRDRGVPFSLLGTMGRKKNGHKPVHGNHKHLPTYYMIMRVWPRDVNMMINVYPSY